MTLTRLWAEEMEVAEMEVVEMEVADMDVEVAVMMISLVEHPKS